jgi:UDP-N-acetylglucosamine transferase subunit ALG13
MEAPRADLCLPASPGGHLELLAALVPAYAEIAHLFITPVGGLPDQLAASGHRVARLVNPHRNPARLPRNVAQALALVAREHPRVVLTSGAGLTVPFCLAAKARGARLIFIETMARVHGGSATGRLLYRVADRFLVQWPELLAVYPRAELCRPVLLEPILSRAAEPRGGTLIMTGNHTDRFDRLLELADLAASRGLLPEPIVAQDATSSYRPVNFEVVPRLAFDELQKHVADSRVIISHGGAGFISATVRAGRKPLVLPRRGSLGEHVDDHQVAMVAKLASLGLVVSLDATPLEEAIARAEEAPGPDAPLEGADAVERVRELLAEAL